MYRWMNREVIKVKYIVINDCFGTIAVCILFFFGFWIHVRGREMGLCVVQSCAELGRVVEGVETVETVERMGVGEEVGKGVRVG